MNKPYFCRNFVLIDLRHKRLKNTIDLLFFTEKTSMDFLKVCYEARLTYARNYKQKQTYKNG